MPASPGVKCGFGLSCRQPAECMCVLADMCVYLCFFCTAVPSQLGGFFHRLQQSVGGHRSQVEEAQNKNDMWLEFIV